MSYPYGPPPPTPYGPPPGYGQPPPYGQPPFNPGVRTQEDQNLDLLGVLFYVYSAFVALVSLGIVGVGFAEMLVVSTVAVHAKGGPPAAAFGAIFMVIFGGLGVLFFVKAVVVFFGGRALRARTSYVLPMVGACLSLINIPFGTALGVATLVMLSKPEIKARFAR